MKRLMVVGDRVLISPKRKEKTEAGIYLPSSSSSQPDVLEGTVVALGPGTPIPSSLGDESDEPWKQQRRVPKYLPVQARLGDHAIFFRKAAVELSHEGQTYLVVPESAILVLIREPSDDDDPSGETLPDDLSPR